MDLLDSLECSKLLISGKFKYFHYNSSSNSLELLDGHFANGVDFEFNITSDDVCLLNINDSELKYDEANGKITTCEDLAGSKVILEACNDISVYLKTSQGYFNEDLKLVEKEKAVKLQALWANEADKSNYQPEIVSSTNDNIGNSLISIEGLPITLNSQFQIILDGNSCDYADEFQGKFVFANDSYEVGDKFQLVKVNSKLTLFNPLYGHLGRGINGYETECMYYTEIPDNLAYLEKFEDNGMYIMRCSGGEDSEDDYLEVDWVKCSYGPVSFTNKKENASIMQFTICYEESN